MGNKLEEEFVMEVFAAASGGSAGERTTTAPHQKDARAIAEGRAQAHQEGAHWLGPPTISTTQSSMGGI